jgi:hypothetical protein
VQTQANRSEKAKDTLRKEYSNHKGWKAANKGHRRQQTRDIEGSKQGTLKGGEGTGYQGLTSRIRDLHTGGGLMAKVTQSKG